MGLFGTLCLIAAASPLESILKTVVVSVRFGFTGGIRISHLVRRQPSGRPEAGRDRPLSADAVDENRETAGAEAESEPATFLDRIEFLTGEAPRAGSRRPLGP